MSSEQADQVPVFMAFKFEVGETVKKETSLSKVIADGGEY